MGGPAEPGAPPCFNREPPGREFRLSLRPFPVAAAAALPPSAWVAPVAAVAAGSMAAVEARVCETAGCSSEAKLQCPTCIKLGIQGSYFCSQVNRRCSGRSLPANGRSGRKLRPQRFPRRALGPSGAPAPAAPARLPVGLETGVPGRGACLRLGTCGTAAALPRQV